MKDRGVVGIDEKAGLTKAPTVNPAAMKGTEPVRT
jgi:hypothetical protein